MTENDFLNKYNIVVNHIDQNAAFGGFNRESESGCMFETFGEELNFVIEKAKENIKKIWTILECDGSLFVSAGYHRVNRLGYLISEQEWESETEEYVLDNFED